MNRLEKLRALMKVHACDGYLITDSDNHYTYYSLLQEDRRINWITECQAQCGLALVTLNQGAVFQVPSNYRLLAEAEMDDKVWSIVDDVVEWIRKHDLTFVRLGYDPHLTPFFVIRAFQKLGLHRCVFHPILSSINFIDLISNHETTAERSILTPIRSLDVTRFAGETSEDKIARLRTNYLNKNEEKLTLITTAMDEIGWLLNLRANDMICNPLFYSFMIVSADELILFTDNPREVRQSILMVKFHHDI
jgi:Xaa-Pro aminopeptidase